MKRVRGGLSFRELFTRYREEVLSLTPCLLTSPASLATFVPPDSPPFDLVVFDEASQIRVAQAIGAIGRGRAVVVVGDSKQMPPSTTMQVTRDEPGAPIGDESDADVFDPGAPAAEDFESILTESVESGLPQQWLSWHYRSQDESLIAFSNRRYYGNRLASLPSPGRAPGTGLSWRRVHGVFGRAGTRTNPVEAAAIVEEITARLADPARAADSLGVVTLNIQQRDLILDLLEKHPDDRVRGRIAATDETGIFVKNLESVQGDERDVVLFSLAFSPDASTGRLPLNFGPLTQTGGERRWNVAITRARRQVVVFSSFDPADVDLSRTRSQGAADLRAYLELAAQDGDTAVLPTAAAARRVPGQFLTAVAAGLADRGLEVTTGLGLSRFTVDLAARRPGAGRWQLAVLLDGPDWASLPTVADREGSPQLLVDLMGWAGVARVWLASWVRDAEQVLDDLVSALNQAADREGGREAIPSEPESVPTGPGTAGTSRPDDVDSTEPRHVQPAAPAAGPAALDRWPGDELPAGSDEKAVLSDTELDEPAPVARSADPAVPSSVTPAAAIRALETPTPATPAPIPAPSPPAGPSPTPGPARLPFVPARTTVVGEPGDLDRLHVGAIQRLLSDQLEDVVRTEGPVARQRLARVVGQRFGLARVRADRVESIMRLVPADLVHGSGDEQFVWPAGANPDRWRDYRTANAEHRSLGQIPLEEIANAMLDVSRTTRITTATELARAALAALGYLRLTDGVRTRLDEATELALQTGRLVRDGDRFVPGL